MVTPAEDLLTQLYKMAAASPRREICGVLTKDQIYPIVNVAQQDHHFVLQKSGYFRTVNKLKEEGTPILAIYHSHINGDPTPSKADIEAAHRTGLNYLIVTTQKYCWVEV
jgi:proteasome lid subunit RPN8/RPN11